MSRGEELVLRMKLALRAAELELRGVSAVRLVHQQVLAAISDAEQWEQRNDLEEAHREGEERMNHPDGYSGIPLNYDED